MNNIESKIFVNSSIQNYVYLFILTIINIRNYILIFKTLLKFDTWKYSNLQKIF